MVVGGKEKKKKREIYCLPVFFAPQMAVVAGAMPAQNQEPGTLSGSPVGWQWQWRKHWGRLPLVSQAHQQGIDSK